MSDKQEVFTVESHLRGGDKRRIEGLLDPLHFDALFDYANKLLVSKPISYTASNEPLSTEARIVQQCGTRGLRTAFELMTGTEQLTELPAGDTPDAELEAKDIFEVRADSPLAYPLAFSGELDRPALEKAELLGEQLMADMFKILGQDAYVMADRMRNAETDEEQLAIAEWLDERLFTMVRSLDDPANDGLNDVLRDAPADLPRGYTYHPARLSGPIIGTYPEHRISPTCLGVSIAAAGFMQRAGLDILHGGVMQSRRGHTTGVSEFFLRDLPEIVSARFNITLPDKFTDRTLQGADHLLNQFLADTGYHHCVLVRLKSGAWMQIDPNFGTTQPFNLKETGPELDKTLAFLKEMKDIAPGLEVTQELENYSSYASSMSTIIKESTTDRLPSQQSAEDHLLTIDPTTDSIQTHFYDTFAAPFFAESNDQSESFTRALDFVTTQLQGFQTREGEAVLYDTFCSVLEKYVLDGMAPAEYLQKCQDDPHFLQRAANDLRSAPLMMTAAIAMNMMDSEMHELAIHPAVEVGLPATRIGLAALSDVAQFHDISPSPTFWLSNWPSLQPITEVPYLEYKSQSQRDIIHNSLASLGQRGLLYTVTYGKVSRIQSDSLSREEDDGQEQEVQT